MAYCYIINAVCIFVVLHRPATLRRLLHIHRRVPVTRPHLLTTLLHRPATVPQVPVIALVVHSIHHRVPAIHHPVPLTVPHHPDTALQVQSTALHLRVILHPVHSTGKCS